MRSDQGKPLGKHPKERSRPVSRLVTMLVRRGVASVALACVALASTIGGPATAFTIELKDVAPDRIERQRAEAIGQIPFPGTPNIAQFDQRLKDKGLSAGAAMFIRVFKAENELEVWLLKGERFELFATYPMCHWSGTLGPKVSEGDKQAPEGVYTVGWRQLHMVGRHPRSLNLGFPNPFDRQFQRTGSWILIHGGCGSVGCYAMTNPIIEEIFSLAQAAIRNGQEAIHVHAFPFRMREAELRAHALHDWYDFWRNLKDVYDAFEQTKRVPNVTVCEGRYWVQPEQKEVASHPPLAVCGAPLVASLSNPMASVRSQTSSNSLPLRAPRAQSRAPERPALTRANLPTASAARPPLSTMRAPAMARATLPAIKCERGLASCRKWLAARETMAARSISTAGLATTRSALGGPTPRKTNTVTPGASKRP